LRGLLAKHHDGLKRQQRAPGEWVRPMIVCERITSWIMPARMLSGLDQGSDHGSNHLGMAQLGSSHPSSVSL